MWRFTLGGDEQNDTNLKDKFESLLIERNIFKDLILKGLEITKKSIIKNKVILTGGMAIDGALRLKNTQLYPDDTLPDYDFITPNFHTIAYDLCKEMAADIESVQAIGAMHPSTMRVRVFYTVVADCTYMPEELYKKIPTLTHNGIRIVHPHYQMIDQHLALCLPYGNAPWETINHRWKKDMIRYDLLNQYYPIPEIKISNVKISKHSHTLTDIIKKSACVGGFYALAYWYDIAKKAGYKEKHKLDPNMGSMILYTNDVFTLKDNIKAAKLKWYNPISDKVFRRIECETKNGPLILVDVCGKLISAHCDSNVWYANLQVIMLRMLTMTVVYKCKISHYGYKIAQSLLYFAAANYNDNTKYLLPSAEIYPGKNIPEPYILSRQYFKTCLGEGVAKKLRPRNAYLDSQKRSIDPSFYNFDPTKSDIYHFGGELREIPFEPIAIPQ